MLKSIYNENDIQIIQRSSKDYTVEYIISKRCNHYNDLCMYSFIKSFVIANCHLDVWQHKLLTIAALVRKVLFVCVHAKMELIINRKCDMCLHFRQIYHTQHSFFLLCCFKTGKVDSVSVHSEFYTL